MKQTADFLAQAQARIEKVCRDYKPTLMAAYGNVEHEMKADDSPVTKLDKELELLLRDALRGFDSSIGLRGEEHDDEGNETTFWLIDPIDGTESFIRGIPYVRNMVTLIDNGEPVFAFVYKVIDDELLIATKGGGATSNGRPLRVSDRPLKGAVIDMYVPLNQPDAVAMAAAIQAQTRGLCIVREFTLVPEGKIEGQLIYNSSGGAWDYAPRALLITEAGGRVANIGSDSYDYRNLDWFGTNAVIFNEVQQLINQALETVKA